MNHKWGYLHYHESSPKVYGGRQKLPDNLKQLFRPVAMSVPEGFKSAQIMAQRIVALFLLSRQLLSMQQHHEWTPFAETHLVSRKSVAAGSQAQSR